MLRKSHCRLGSSPEAEEATQDSPRGPPWPQRKNSGHSLEVCHWPNGPQGWGVAPWPQRSSAPAFPSSSRLDSSFKIRLQLLHLSICWSLSPHTGSLLAPVRYIDLARARGMTMTTSKEQEAFGLVVERQKSSASENDIRNAFQRFMETAGVAEASEMTTERPPGVGNPGRMDLYVTTRASSSKRTSCVVAQLTQNT